MAESFFDTIMQDTAIPALEKVFGIAATHTTAETIGEELLASDGWNVGDHWSEAPAGVFSHEAGVGYTAALGHSAAITSSTEYLLSWAMTWRTTGSITINIGGQAKAGITGSYNWRLTASDTAGLILTPTETFDGSLSALSLKPINAGVSTSGITVMMQMELIATGEFGERMEERQTLELAKSHGAHVGDTFVIDTKTYEAAQLLTDDDYLQKFAVVEIT